MLLGRIAIYSVGLMCAIIAAAPPAAAQTSETCQWRSGVSYAASFVDLGAAETYDVKKRCENMKDVDPQSWRGEVRLERSGKRYSPAYQTQCVNLTNKNDPNAGFYCSRVWSSSWNAKCCAVYLFP